jgi:putative transposase
MLKAFQYYLLPDQEQKLLLSKFFGCARVVYNRALSQQKLHYSNSYLPYKQLLLDHPESKPKEKVYAIIPTFTLCSSFLKTWKEELPFLKECSAPVLQQSVLHLNTAFNNFFSKKAGFPKYKSKYGDQSISFPQYVYADFKSNRIQIPKLGKVHCILHRRFDGRIKTCTVSRTVTGLYFISILVEDGKELPTSSYNGNAIGLDLGIKDYVTFSDGSKVDNPKYYEKELKKIARLNQILSRQEKGSNNYKKTQHKLAKLAEKVRNKRKDFQHKLSRDIVNKNQVIIVETLAVQEMLENSPTTLSRKIQDAGWSQFVEMLKYKTEWEGKVLVKIGRFEPTSKKCHCCGHLKEDLVLSDRSWKCSNCGTEHDRDVNAAINILNLGLEKAQILGTERTQLKEVEDWAKPNPILSII